MFKSIRWRFIIIYFLLVFIAMAIVGVYIVDQFEKYHLSAVSDQLNRIAEDYILPSVAPYDDLDKEKDKIQSTIDTWSKGFREEIFIINENFQIIATSNANLIGKNAIDILEYTLIIDAAKGDVRELDLENDSGLRTKNLVFPIVRGEKTIGILYIRDSLNDIYETLDESKWILTQATMLALFITIILGYLLAKSVTEPIAELTRKAARMANGEFEQKVDVKSDDEIGRLGEMFNELTDKLKNTLGEISSEKSKLETILNNMADGLLAVDLKGTVIHANPKAMDILGIEPKNLEKGFDAIIGEYDKNLTIKNIGENNPSWVGSRTLNVGNSIYRSDYAPFTDEHKEYAGLVILMQDVTEQQRLDNMRKEFVANVSHELKTPLTSIKSYTETLLEGAVDDKAIALRFLSVIDSESDRMTRLVRDLLQLSNFDYEKVAWEKGCNDVVDLIRKAVVKMDVTAESKDMKISFSTETDSMEGFFDHDKIEQVFLNVLSNAIKYSDDSTCIEISLIKDDDKAVIFVKDQGIGIPEEDMDRIFDRFYRVDKARSRSLGGTGLGLSISKKIIEGHGGNIEIKSRAQQGTEVVFSFPLESKLCRYI
jgi:two-component system sensor histidine kinase VicK